jgi:hypothetical protein
MPQGKETPNEIIQMIRTLLLENEKLTGKEVKAKVEDKFSKVHYSVRTYQSKIKEELPKVKILKSNIPENTWSIGSSANTNEIMPEAIPHIIELQKWALMQKESITQLAFPPITVRQGKWVSRLLPLYFTIVGHDKKMTAVNLPDVNPYSDKLGWLWRWSKVYSIEERLYELTGKKEKHEAFDTSILDAALVRQDRIDIFGDTYVRFSGDNQKITVITSDESIIKRSVDENIIEKTADYISELPKFKKVMKERGGQRNE